MQSEIKNIKSTSPAGTTPSLGFVLIVDDEEQNRTLLRDPLEARGYEVAEAENGAEALQKIAGRPSDVILLDLMMPKMDGFEACRRLRKDAKTSHIPILMITALSARKERLMGIEAGANDFLAKPVDIQDVILRVGNAVYAKQLHDQLRVEQEKSERLLLNILPKPTAQRITVGDVGFPLFHPDVTVLVADLAGQGATFRVYFLQVQEAIKLSDTSFKKKPLPRTTETLLVVEDEPAVRLLACDVLRSQGYEVLSATNGRDGLRVARQHKGEAMSLVITDVIMPQMGGKAMAEWLKSSFPGIKILYTSGYTDAAIVRHGVLDQSVAFLPKPYTPATLTRAVRELLDAPETTPL